MVDTFDTPAVTIHVLLFVGNALVGLYQAAMSVIMRPLLLSANTIGWRASIAQGLQLVLIATGKKSTCSSQT